MIAYKVYWTEYDRGLEINRSKEFTKDDLGAALKVLESLRKIQREQGNIRFIILAGEHPDSVCLPGVDVTGPEYDWKKRRQ